MIDATGRNIDYIRVSLTDRCNLRCVYCMPEAGVIPLPHDEILRKGEIFSIIKAASELGIKRVRLTGGEPLVRKGVVSLIERIAELDGIEDISLTTNGILLPKMAKDLKSAGLSRVNISLDTLDAEQYHQVTRLGDIEDALAGIEAALEYDFSPVKINTVSIRGLNQDFAAFAKMTIERPLHIRFIEFMPIGDSSHCGISGKGWGPEDVIPSDELRDHIAQLMGVELVRGEVEGGGPANYYKIPGAVGTLGFISPMSNHFCGTCNRIRLTSDGKLRQCLFSDEEIDVKKAMREASDDERDEVIKRVLAQAIDQKPKSHNFAVGTKRSMNKIGG